MRAPRVVFICLIVSLLPCALFAQWLPSGATNTTPISHNASVTVGTDTISSGFMLDVNGTTRLGGNIFLGSPTFGVATLYLWPDASGTRIRGTGSGIDLVSGGGTIHLYNGNTAIDGWDSTPAVNTALTVKGSTASSGNAALKVTDVVGMPLMFVRNDGNVGIGTASPQARIHAFAGSGPVAVRAEIGDNPGTNATMAIDNVIGPYLVSHSDTAGQATAAYAAHRVTFGAQSFTIAYAPATAAGNARTWTDQLTIDTAGKVGIGMTPSYTLDVNGTIHATQIIGATYQDVAEWVPADAALSPGTVVVLDRRAANHVTASKRAYDASVAGVVSEKPGVILGEAGADKAQIATTGRVHVKVDASKSAIEIGDLLVTSDTPGFAMKSEPIELRGRSFHQPGTLLGKALEPLPAGKGEILVLLSLQ